VKTPGDQTKFMEKKSALKSGKLDAKIRDIGTTNKQAKASRARSRKQAENEGNKGEFSEKKSGKKRIGTRGGK